MAQSEKLDFDATCRVCLKTIDIFHDSAELFGETDEIALGSMICALSAISMVKDDGLPQQVCSECQQKILDGYALRTECIENDRKLRGSQPLQDIKDEEDDDHVEAMDDIQEPEMIIKEEENWEVKLSDDPEDSEKTVTKKVRKYKKGEKPRSSLFKIRCCMCEYPAETDAALRVHVNEKHPKVEEQQGKVITARTVKCEFCLKYFKNNSGYREHFRRPYAKKDFVCVRCGVTVRSKGELKNHEKQHEESNQILPCAVCHKIFKKDKNLKRHMKVHEPNYKKFQCNYCAKLFTEKKSLESHIRQHLGIRDFPCQLCPKQFVSKQLLTIHMRAHTGERPHACWCGKAYKHNTDLKRHQYEHTNTRPFKCQYCDRTFFQRSNMKVHERVHTGELPFECHICKQRFKHHAHWRLHLKKHSEESAPVAPRLF